MLPDMSDSSSPLPDDPHRRSRVASGVLHLNRQAARTGKAAVGTVLAAALISGAGSTPVMAWEAAGQIPAVDPRDSGRLAARSTQAHAGSEVTERLGAVAQELDEAVGRGEVTLEQALAFFAQIHAKVLADLE